MWKEVVIWEINLVVSDSFSAYFPQIELQPNKLQMSHLPLSRLHCPSPSSCGNPAGTAQAAQGKGALTLYHEPCS